MRLRLTVLFVIVTAVAVPATASASEIIDRNANDVSLNCAAAFPKTGPCPPLGTTQRNEPGIAE